MGTGGPCEKEIQEEKEACGGGDPEYTPYGETNVCVEAGLADKKKKNAEWAKDKSKKASANECIEARRCRLVPYKSASWKPQDGTRGCCPSQTGDHLIPKSSFYKASVAAKTKVPGWENYKQQNAPCMCLEGGTNTHGTHGLRHTHHLINGPKSGKGSFVSFSSEVELAAKGALVVTPNAHCSKDCIAAQLEAGHRGMRSEGAKDPKVKHSPSGSTMSKKELKAQVKVMAPGPPK
jgi:hypothetical protein